MERIYQVIAWLMILLISWGCMPKIENEDPVESVTITGNDIISPSAGNARIHIYGTCPQMTKNFKVSVDQDSYSVSSASGLVESSGVPIGTCTNGAMVITYPVPNPATSRTISFKIKAQMNDGRISLYWAQANVNYALPVPAVKGFAVTSGGGSVTGGGDKVMGTTEIISPIILNHPNLKVRSGLNGIIFDDSI